MFNCFILYSLLYWHLSQSLIAHLEAQFCHFSWNCDICISERLLVLEGKLRDNQTQTEELKWRNKALEEQLVQTENGKDVGKVDMVTVKPEGEKCLVLGDSMVRNGGAEKSDIKN